MPPQGDDRLAMEGGGAKIRGYNSGVLRFSPTPKKSNIWNFFLSPENETSIYSGRFLLLRVRWLSQGGKLRLDAKLLNLLHVTRPNLWPQNAFVGPGHLSLSGSLSYQPVSWSYRLQKGCLDNDQGNHSCLEKSSTHVVHTPT